MIREIEFRGRDKRYDGTWEPWMYGSLDLSDLWPAFIENGPPLSVQRKTVGQYIGLKVDNGVEIYEGDVVSCNTFRGVVKYDSYTASFQAVSAGWWPISLEYDKHDPFEVIGNIFDNPELDKQFGEVYRKEQ